MTSLDIAWLMHILTIRCSCSSLHACFLSHARKTCGSYITVVTLYLTVLLHMVTFFFVMKHSSDVDIQCSFLSLNKSISGLILSKKNSNLSKNITIFMTPNENIMKIYFIRYLMILIWCHKYNLGALFHKFEKKIT